MNEAEIFLSGDGEAHSNPYIDNCMKCLPFWEQIPLCPKCNQTGVKSGLQHSTKFMKKGIHVVGEKDTLYCNICKRHFEEAV